MPLSQGFPSATLLQGSRDRIDFVCRNVWLDDKLSSAEKRAFFMSLVGVGMAFVEEIDKPGPTIAERPAEQPQPNGAWLDMLINAKPETVQ